MIERLYLQHLTSKRDTNGNPRRLFVLYRANGDIQDIFDEGYEGMPVVIVKDKKIQLVYSNHVDDNPVIQFHRDRDKIQYVVNGCELVVVSLPGFSIPISEYKDILKSKSDL